MTVKVNTTAIDIGSGNVEYIITNKEGQVVKGRQPSIVSNDGKIMSARFGRFSTHVWETEGQRYAVDENASDYVDTCRRDYHLHPAQRVLLQDTLAHNGMSGKKVIIGTNMPTAQYFFSNEDGSLGVNQARVEQKINNLRVGIENLAGGFDAADIIDAIVYPEAIPGYYYCASLAPEAFPEKHATLIVDLGKFTNDMAIITTGDTVRNWETTENGTHKFIQNMRNQIAKIGEQVEYWTDTQILDVVAQGYIGSTLETEKAIANRIDMSEAIAHCQEQLFKLIEEDVIEFLKASKMSMGGLTRICLIGGGAHIIGELMMEEMNTVVTIPMDPEMATVEGINILLQGEIPYIIEELGLNKTAKKAPAIEAGDEKVNEQTTEDSSEH